MKFTTIRQYLLVLMASSIIKIMCSSLYGNETDRLSLLEFKKAISMDPQQALMSWNDSNYFCSWEGVSCRVKTPHRVISLNLTNRGLIGQMSPSLGNLTFLKFLFLPANSFTGEIPQSLGNMHHLQIIYLSNNTLQGKIPNLANCSNLKVLWLNGNNLVGQIPADLPQRFQSLQLSINSLTGPIPVYVANITTLKRFSCLYNNIDGNIPDDFAKLPVLVYLHLGANKLAGQFPQAILNLSTLVELTLASNHLSGELPSNIGDSVPNLQKFQLGGNFFYGHIPNSLTNASKLNLIDISINSFTGVVPRSIGKLTKLSWLNLELNKFHAHSQKDLEFMNSLANCTELQMFSIYGNRFEGNVPNSFGNHSTQLQYIHMGLNQFSGLIPSGIANIPNLIALELGGNLFTTVIPDWLGGLKSLQTLSLFNNLFTGPIPPSLSNLSNLVELGLSTNQLDGYIPPSLGYLQVLEEFTISHNNINGWVPNEIFGIPTISLIWLSFNYLEGELPSEVGNAKQLMYLHLTSNKLSGDIPSTLGNCESLVDIKLDQNVFTGNIPITLGNISSLRGLNLSHNNLSGTIPVSLGDLELLQQLDLSFNHLTGHVPTKGVFKNTTAIQIDGNQGLCGGIPELHLLECPVMPLNSTKHKHSVGLKVVIPLATTVSLAVTIVFALFFWREKQKRKSVSLPSFDSSFPKVSYHDLARATDGFSASNLIGRGRYGSVYKAQLFHGRNVVAVKVFSLETKGTQKSFIAECNALRNVRHRNLVPILTACSTIDSRGNDFKASVYKFMARGDLYELLYSTGDDENTSTSNHITLAQRLSIIVDVADALEYLHHNNQGTIVHCDLKPSNILLDDNMTAHVGDFGLARLKIDSTASTSADSTSSIAIKGTIGYIAPECASGGGQVSTVADVYSFGIILLEIFLRKRPTDNMFKDGLDIAKYVEMNSPDRTLNIVDPELLDDKQLQEIPVTMKEKCIECLVSVLNTGLCCVKISPNERMAMQEVAARLHVIKEAYAKAISGNNGIICIIRSTI
uniref:Receptor kinase-like protein Xa21 n=1 Tax=Oryza rufipogon TaxID=4529 RepID=A0A0E0R4S5_ORYRU